MLPDIAKYSHHLDSFDLSEERKVELIRTVWGIMEGFVDQAFGAHPVQQVAGREPRKFPTPPRNAVELSSLAAQFAVEADPEDDTTR